MPRSQEQVAADDNLTVAVERCIAAYGEPEPAVVLTDFVVVYAQQGWDAEGYGCTRVDMLLRDGDLANYRLLGLLQSAVSRSLYFATHDRDPDQSDPSDEVEL